MSGKLRFFVDRIEEDVAVLISHDPEVEIAIPIFILPDGISEGDWLTAAFERDDATRERMRRDIEDLMGGLGDDP